MKSKQISTRVFDDISYGSIDPGESLTESFSEQKCTLLESASNLIAVVTGAGMLSLPYAAAAMGWSALVLLVILLVCFMYSYFLLVHSIEQVKRRHIHNPIMVDYVILGKEAFGKGGDKIVLVLLMSELFLALVSFIINIGVNTNVIFRSITEAEAIVLSGIASGFLSFLDMKHISKFTSCGNIMTALTIIALTLSGMYLPANSGIPLNYKFLDFSGVSVSLGVMAYCFGGHGAFPKIYQSMAEPQRHHVCIAIVAASVFIIYALIIIVGYSYYGCHTQIPVTVNIGSDLQGFDLPNARLVSIFASLGLIANIQATCPIIVLTISDMYTTAHGRPHQHGNIVIVLIVGAALLAALGLRGDFLQVCGIVGAFATISSSIFLPVAFYHQLYKHAEISRITYVVHTVLVCIATLAMLVGVTSSVCGIIGGSDSTVCHYTNPSSSK